MTSPPHPTTPHTHAQVEYDLAHSSEDDLRLLSVDRIEQSALPTALSWYPPLSKESFLLLANDQVGPQALLATLQSLFPSLLTAV